MMQRPPKLTRSHESDIPGIFTSEHVSLDVPGGPGEPRPAPVKFTYAIAPCPVLSCLALHPTAAAAAMRIAPPPLLLERSMLTPELLDPSLHTTPRCDTTSGRPRRRAE